MIPLPKGGDPTQCSNYRTISLISHTSKIFLKIILERLKKRMEEVLAEEQAGFRKGRNTIEQIFVLRLLSEKAIEHNRKIYHAFIDFQKAFDSVWQGALWAIMEFYGFPKKIIAIVQTLYSKAETAVRVNGELTEWFKMGIGVRQGCLLSPVLFNIFLEYIMAKVLEGTEAGISIAGRLLNNLRFADDIDLLTATEDQLQELVTKLQEVASEMGMDVNKGKTKVMMTSKENKEMNIRMNNQELEQVHSFKYLGSIMTDDAKCEADVKRRLGLAAAAATKLEKILKSQETSMATKLRLIRTLVFTIAAYGSETWTLTSCLEKRIEAFDMRLYRKILRISYMDRVSNAEVLNRMEIKADERLLEQIKIRKLTYFGHVCRQEGERLPRMVLEGTLEGKRSKGRPRLKWTDNIQKWTGESFLECKERTQNRTEWKKWCKRRRPAVSPQRSTD
jgi:hypothetical protein